MGIVLSEEPRQNRMPRVRRLPHITPLARCARTSSGLPIGIAHIGRQRVGYAVTRHVAPVPLAERIGGVLLAVVLGLSAAALLFYGCST